MKRFYRFLFIMPLIIIIFSSLHFINQSSRDLNINHPEKLKENITPAIKINDKDSLRYKSIGEISSRTKDGWDLVWQDEFNQNFLDSTKWTAEDWASKKNNELQYYSPANIHVEDGLLKITSKREKYRGRDFTSGAIHTKGKFDFLYGKVEMRAKLPAGKGIFPAFWMMANNEQTWLPEIDIMEMLGDRPDEIWMVSHWLDIDGKLKSESNIFTGEDFTQDFHTFSIEWTQDSITWFIDDVARFQTTTSIPDEKMYLYLNTAVGGDWPGSPEETTTFPVEYIIDYVRVYQKQ